MKYLFICVHPDDLEFNCSNLMWYLSQKEKSVHILSLTKGEFGIFDPKWKGPQLGYIRQHELIKAATVNGIDPEHIHFDDIIDGFVQFNRAHIEKLLLWINKIQPDIILAPEPYFTYYWHSDHINCGRMAFYIYKNLQHSLKHPIKSLLFYTTFKPNFVWPFKDPQHAFKSLYLHKSQWWLLKRMGMFYPIEKRNLNFKKIGRWKFVERYRRVLLHKKEPKANRILKTILGIISNLHLVNPPQKHFVVPNWDTSFGQKILRLREKYGFQD
ncbi:hypothetical protein NEF87_005046 [Candidatus Lokiarchaeum ossiferum]|uniref:PIG-L family deacetylase n=1 Tax=Candidatus Lokiarchaeum ossiferum TaxID=2951803 RepID=A0ABY6HZ09_9ARCH|nr:hypothetical protein NEF87_005046 [Candidatus Lokiarchaeum sp. B-35]